MGRCELPCLLHRSDPSHHIAIDPSPSPQTACSALDVAKSSTSPLSAPLASHPLDAQTTMPLRVTTQPGPVASEVFEQSSSSVSKEGPKIYLYCSSGRTISTFVPGTSLPPNWCPQSHCSIRSRLFLPRFFFCTGPHDGDLLLDARLCAGLPRGIKHVKVIQRTKRDGTEILIVSFPPLAPARDHLHFCFYGVDRSALAADYPQILMPSHPAVGRCILISAAHI